MSLLPQTIHQCIFYSQQGGHISVPDIMEDDSEGSIEARSDDLESAVPTDSKKEGVKFGWIRGVLVSWAGKFCVLQNSGCHRA